MKRLFSLLSVSLLVCGFLINCFSVVVRADASLVFGEGSYDLASEAGTGKIQIYFKDGASATANSKQVSDFGWGVWDRTDYLSATIVDMKVTQGLYASNAYTTGQWYPFLYIPGLFMVNHRYDIVVNFSTNIGYVSAGNGVYTNRGSDYIYNENKSDYASNYMQFRYSFFCKKDFYGLMIGNGTRWGSYPMDGKGKVYANNVSIYCRDLNKNSDLVGAVNDTKNAVNSQGEATRQTIENQYDASGTGDFGGDISGITNEVSGALGGVDDDVGGLEDIFSGTPPPAQVAFPGFSMMGEQVWSSQVYQFSQLESQVGPLITAVRLILSVLVYLALINYCHKVYKSIFGGD